MSHWICSGPRAAVVAGVAAVCAMLGGMAAGATTSAADPRMDGLMRASDLAAPLGESPDQTGERRSLLFNMVTRAPHCFVANPTPEQMEYIMQHFNALPVGQVKQAGMDRFFASGTAWVGNGGQGSSGQANRATLRISFPNDGVPWDGAPNELNSRLITRFGAANLDRGRELIRQGFASWRRVSSLTYSEVADTNVGFSQSTSNVGGGDVRIGATAQGGGGVLAYNYFPTGGGDMSINASELVSTSLLDATNNYRYLRNVAAHEHGHGLGFIHPTPCNGTKLMEPFANTNFEMTQIDEIRGAGRNYGDRFAGNNSAGNAKDFGDLTSPILKSIIERNLSTNGTAGANNTDEDWFKFTIGSSQAVSVTVAPIGGSYANGQQTSGCNPTAPPTVNAMNAGNLNIELRDSAGVTVLQTANTAAAGINEVLNAGTLAPGTYSVRVFDVGPNGGADQIVQVYDLTIRLGTSRAAPQAIAGINKRVQAGQLCFFMGDTNSRVTESGATLNNASYDWDLDGDSIFETNDQTQPTRTYANNGIVNVTLRVTDSNGMASTDTITVTVAGATPAINSVTPSTGTTGSTVPVTIVGISLGGVAASSQVTVSGTGVTVSGTPVVTGGGTTLNGLSFIVAAGAATGARTVNITNADGTGQNAALANAFAVVTTPPANDTCAAPISWGSVTGARPFSNTNATTGTPQSFPTTGCPAAGPINNDTWYSWTSPSNGNLNITTDSATAGTPAVFSSRIACYNTTTCPPTGLQGCDDFGVAFNVFAQGGRTYLFQVGGTLANVVGNANVILTFTPILGACCDSSGNCSLQPSNACIGGSLWQGSGTTCELFPCDPPLGTCCAANGTCTETDAGGCTGLFAPGGTCTPNPCEQPSGSCCAADGGCVVGEQSACTGGRVWTLGGVCTPNPCPQPNGACCAADGSCTTATQAACSGSWQGAGSVCSPNPCPQPTGACCNAGVCTETTMAACTGVFQGNGTTCTPNPCPQLTGACCNSTSCSVGTQMACTGVYQGNSTICGTAGNPTTCCPANFNITGGITVQDIFDFLAAYFGGAPGADFNGVGGITVQDIFDYLAAYFTGCP